LWEGIKGRGYQAVLPDGFKHAIRVLDHLAVPEAKHCESLLAQVLIPNSIHFPAGCVLPAIHFDDQFPLEAGEVDDVSADGLLAPELQAGELLPAKMAPQEGFDTGRVSA
jgi:hypothetical protein